MIQDEKAGTESDSDPEAQDVVDLSAELGTLYTILFLPHY